MITALDIKMLRDIIDQVIDQKESLLYATKIVAKLYSGSKAEIMIGLLYSLWG